MGGPRRPMDVNLSVVSGKHWTQAEIDDRRNSECKVPPPKTLTPPKWLCDEAKKLFRQYAKLLLDLPAGLVSKLDVGTLARHCDAEYSYSVASQHKEEWLKIASDRFAVLISLGQVASSDPDYEYAKEQVEFWILQMSKLEKICRGGASEMGMTISSRCKLVVPKVEKPAETDPVAALQQRFFGGGM